MDAPNIRSKRWDIKTLELKTDPLWGIPVRYLTTLVGQQLIGPNTLQTPRISFLQFQNIVAHLHKNNYDTTDIAGALEKWNSEIPTFSGPDGYTPFNEKWVLVAGTWGQRIAPFATEICTRLGKALASKGYGLITGDGQGVDFQVSLAFAQELGGMNIDDKTRLQMVLMPKQSTRHQYGQRIYTEGNEHWCNYVMSEASALVTIGGEGGTRDLFGYADRYNVPVLPVEDTGGDTDKILQVITALDKLKPKHPDAETFKKQVEDIYQTQPITDPVDLQKDRWSGRYATTDKILEATIDKGQRPGFFELEIAVRSKVNRLAKGRVAFFLHNSFPNEIEYAEMKDGKASLKVECHEAFTLGAFLDDGASLELDLNTWTGYPKDFYTQKPPEKFVRMMEVLKDHWGKNESRSSGGRIMDATVTPAFIPGYFTVKITIGSVDRPKPFHGFVAFFMRPPFPRRIEYVKATGENVLFTLITRDPFVVRACTENEQLFELDLREFFPAPAPSQNNSNDRMPPP